MISLIRSTLLLAIIGLLAASYLTWEPLPQDGSQPMGDTPANQFATIMDRWAEKIPSLKDDILSLRDDMQSNLSEWKDTASEKTALLSEFNWDNFKVSENSKESFTKMLQQLKEQLGDVDMSELSAKVQELIGKAESLPEETQLDETPTME
jgi:hypothetical protein